MYSQLLQQCMSLLPQCKATQHAQQGVITKHVWVHAHETYPDKPKVQKSGWKLGTDGTKHVWTDIGLIQLS